jgi:hypothetical protein
LCQYPSLTFGFICFLVITFPPPCVSLLYSTRDEMIPPLFLLSCLFSFSSLSKHSLHCIALGSVWRSCARSLFSNGHCLIYCGLLFHYCYLMDVLSKMWIGRPCCSLQIRFCSLCILWMYLSSPFVCPTRWTH